MEQSELLKHLAQSLDRLGLPYLLTGSMATIAYGEPRFTNDIDVVVALKAADVPNFCAAFPAPEFYCSPAAIDHAVRNRFDFNVLHPTSGLKVDVIVATDSEFDQSRLSRAVRMPAGDDFEATFASPEDVIIKKLQFFREGGSEKHLRDIVGVLKVQGGRIDQAYLAKWISHFGLQTEWLLIETRLADEASGAGD